MNVKTIKLEGGDNIGEIIDTIIGSIKEMASEEKTQQCKDECKDCEYKEVCTNKENVKDIVIKMYELYDELTINEKFAFLLSSLKSLQVEVMEEYVIPKFKETKGAENNVNS